MNFYAVSALINAITSLSLGLFVFLKNKRKSVNNTFVLLSLAVFVWSIFYFLWQISGDPDSALLYTRLLSIGSLFVPIFYLHWVLSFLEIKDKKSNIILFLGYIVSFIFLSFSFSPLFIKGVEKILIFDFWPKAGILYSIYLLVSYTGLVGYGLINLLKSYRTSEGLKRYQIRYIIFGTIIGFLGGATNFFLWYDIKILPVGNVIVSLYVFILFYAMIKYRLMDIRVVARKVFIYFGIAAFTYGFFYFLIWLYGYAFGGIFSTAAYLLGIIMAPLFVIFFYRMDEGLKNFANRYLFVSLYNYQETINKMIDELAGYIDLDKIVNLIVDTIEKTMQLDRAGVFLTNTEGDYQIFKINDSNDVSLVHNNFLIKHLLKTKKPLVREELALLSENSTVESEKTNYWKLYQYMVEIKAFLCLPLIVNKKLIGIIVLGSKISGDPYTKEDIDLLNVLSKQAGITIENALQYKQIQEFGKTLQEKVDEQTKDITEKSMYLQELLTMKSDFLRVVSHQLNTPLSIIRGYFSMVKDGDYELDKALPIIEDGLMRIINTVSDFYDAYKLEGEKMKMEPRKTDITAVVDRLVEEKKKLQYAKDRKLKISVESPEFKVPDVWCDSGKITHVISNILDNAVFYTYKGSITVFYELVNNDYLKINVKDTGSGVSEKDRSRIFQKFSRGTNASSMHPDGSGIGLYISKKIVEGNGGEIVFESEGENKGTTFSFTIPVYKGQEKDDKEEAGVKENKIEIFLKNI
jgi:signal transduction histidine kinase